MLFKNLFRAHRNQHPPAKTVWFLDTSMAWPQWKLVHQPHRVYVIYKHNSHSKDKHCEFHNIQQATEYLQAMKEEGNGTFSMKTITHYRTPISYNTDNHLNFDYIEQIDPAKFPTVDEAKAHAERLMRMFPENDAISKVSEVRNLLDAIADRMLYLAEVSHLEGGRCSEYAISKYVKTRDLVQHADVLIKHLKTLKDGYRN